MRTKEFRFSADEISKIIFDKLCADGDLPSGFYRTEIRIDDIYAQKGKPSFVFVAGPPKPTLTE